MSIFAGMTIFRAVAAISMGLLFGMVLREYGEAAMINASATLTSKRNVTAIDDNSSEILDENICSGNILNQLISELHDFPEEKGLHPFTLKSAATGKEYFFPAFTGRSFTESLQNEHLVVFSDSTFRYASYRIADILQNRKGALDYYKPNQTLAEAFKRLPPIHGGRSLDGTLQRSFLEGINSSVAWFGNHGGQSCTREDEYMRQFLLHLDDHPESSVVIFNFGMHYFPQEGYAQLPSPDDTLLNCHPRKWIYHEKILETVIDKAREHPRVRLLLLKNTNLICRQYLPETLVKGWDDHQNATEDVITNCTKAGLAAYPDLEASQLEDYCRNGSFDDHGARYLNDRLSKLINGLPEMSDLEVQLFDDRGMQRCEYTSTNPGVHDGRHYRKLILVRLRALAHVIKCSRHGGYESLELV